jgi:hypothetical protein
LLYPLFSERFRTSAPEALLGDGETVGLRCRNVSPENVSRFGQSSFVVRRKRIRTDPAAPNRVHAPPSLRWPIKAPDCTIIEQDWTGFQYRANNRHST